MKPTRGLKISVNTEKWMGGDWESAESPQFLSRSEELDDLIRSRSNGYQLGAALLAGELANIKRSSCVVFCSYKTSMDNIASSFDEERKFAGRTNIARKKNLPVPFISSIESSFKLVWVEIDDFLALIYVRINHAPPETKLRTLTVWL